MNEENIFTAKDKVVFVLRRIVGKKVTADTIIGGEYVLILKEEDPEEFEKATKLWDDDIKKEMYGVLSFNDAQDLMPLYKKSSYYVMMSNGQTFTNLNVWNNDCHGAGQGNPPQK